VNGFWWTPTQADWRMASARYSRTKTTAGVSGANGRRAVEEKFNWNNVAAYTEGVYQVALR
jgi:hypothetical protein